MGRNEEISLMAYYIWLEERCCHGYDVDHWLRAEAMWEELQKQKEAQQNTGIQTPATVKPEKKQSFSNAKSKRKKSR